MAGPRLPGDYPIPEGATSGTDLARLLERAEGARNSGDVISTRPQYIERGGLWVREATPGAVLEVLLYDGTDDIPISISDIERTLLTLLLLDGSIPNNAGILAVQDLDTIQTPGFYRQLDPIEATQIRNYPADGLAGALMVQGTSGVVGVSDDLTQTWWASNSRVYARTFDFGTVQWSQWYDIGLSDLTKQLDPVQMTILNSDGADVVLTAADAVNAGLMTAADKIALDQFILDGAVVGPQGPEGPTGPQGIPGVGVALQGSASWTEIDAIATPTLNDMWILNTNDVTAPSSAALPGSGGRIGDGMYWSGAAWENLGPIQGPQGDKGDTGDAGPGLPAG
ncbi:MAG: hypothetical protein DRH90_22705, partial [Deltaproteobacteria bacterium]